MSEIVLIIGRSISTVCQEIITKVVKKETVMETNHVVVKTGVMVVMATLAAAEMEIRTAERIRIYRMVEVKVLAGEEVVAVVEEEAGVAVEEEDGTKGCFMHGVQ